MAGNSSGQNLESLERLMNVHLTYNSGQSYSETLSDFTVKVSGGGMRRLKVSFRQKENGHGQAQFSLPAEKAQQLAYAILAATAGVELPIEFNVQELKPKVVAA